MTSPIDIHRVHRRSAFAVSASLLLLPSANGQSQIEPESTEDGLFRGFVRSSGKPGRLGTSNPEANAPTATASAPEAYTDWRDFLLRGERSLIVLDGKRERQIRYVRSDGTLDAEGYVDLCWMLRDRHENRAVHMSIATLDRVCGVQRWAAYHRREAIVQFTNGFRGAKTNARTEGAAKDSLHMQGRAIDGNFLGLTPVLQGNMARDINKEGGVGIYVDRSFVHMDDGRPRVWAGTPKPLRR